MSHTSEENHRSRASQFSTETHVNGASHPKQETHPIEASHASEVNHMRGASHRKAENQLKVASHPEIETQSGQASHVKIENHLVEASHAHKENHFRIAGFDFLLDILQDGKYHTFEDIFARQTQLNENQLEALLAFLDQYSLAKRLRKTWSMRTRMIKLQPEMVNFLRRLKELEACK